MLANEFSKQVFQGYWSCSNALMAAIVLNLNKETTAVFLDQNNPRELNYVLCQYFILFNFVDYARLSLYDDDTTLSITF